MKDVADFKEILKAIHLQKEKNITKLLHHKSQGGIILYNSATKS